MMVETEPIMYTGNGIATEFQLPTGHDGNYVTITAPGAGIKLRVIRDSSDEVVNGRDGSDVLEGKDEFVLVDLGARYLAVDYLAE